MHLFRFIFYRTRNLKERIIHQMFRIRSKYGARISGGSVSWPISAVASMPIRVDGQGHVSIGHCVMLGYRPAPRIGSGEILLQARGKASLISLGARTALSNNITIVAMKLVKIGNDCLIGDLVTIFDCDFHEINPSTRKNSCGKIAPVLIGDNVWLGSRVMVLKGVTIGANTVIAAGSVVTKSIPANVIAAGVPAKVIREIDTAHS